MGRYIAKFEDYYLEWSTVVDAPVTYGMKLEDFKAHYRQQYGEEGMERLPERLDRVEKFGCSGIGVDLKSLVRGNRAGPDEKSLRKGEIYRAYCLREPIRDGWKA